MDSRLAERVELIEQDDRHGASWLAREAVEAVCEAVQMGEDPVALAQRIVRARPAMGAIAGALGRVLVSGRSDEQIIEEARAVIEGRERASKAIAVLLSPHIRGTVMTHSNSATVREAVAHTPPERMVCTVSEPGEDRFDLTSPKHIDLYVTEEGEFPPLDIAALIDRTPFLHDGYALLNA
jgi:translation initiation factor 2B subunit (eIF-2B alpha/beta/delta family)